MSTWAGVELDGMTILETQNHLRRWYFRNSDRVKLPPSPDDPNQLPVFMYRAPAKTIARRLAFDGNDLEYLKQDFKKQLAQMVSDCRKMVEMFDHERCAILLPILEKSTLQDWLDRLKQIWLDRLESAWWRKNPKDYADVLLEFMLSGHEQYFFSDMPASGGYHFPCTSEEMYAVALLQVVPEESYFELDATQMISAGWADEFEDFIEFHQEHTTFYGIFKESLTNTLRLVDLALDEPVLQKMLFANVISIMETYLSDTFRKQVLKRDAVLRRFVRTHEEFKNTKREPFSELFTQLDRLSDTVNSAIDGLSFHNIIKVQKLYKEVLATAFPQNIGELLRAVEVRHDIVHRNGKDLKNNTVPITSDDVRNLARLVDETVNFIDDQVKDGLLDDVGASPCQGGG